MYRKTTNGSWQKVSSWYSKITADDGHFYHKNLILPKLLKLASLTRSSTVLDLGCGSGVLGRYINKDIRYVGIDLSKDLIDQAKRQDKSRNHKYIIGDASNFSIVDNNFSHVFFILSLQNMQDYNNAVLNASKYLRSGGKLYIVLNHPVFRIPRQTSWEIDPKNKLEYRRINRYLSPLKIPINMNPSDKNSEHTWSYHFSLSELSSILKKSNLLISEIQEWSSGKESRGRNAKMENRARSEFPLFMAIECIGK